MPSSWIYPSYVHSRYVGYEGQGIYHQCNLSPNHNFLEYDQRKDYVDLKQAYESSAESLLKDSQCLMDSIVDHEHIKSATALFTLSSTWHIQHYA